MKNEEARGREIERPYCSPKFNQIIYRAVSRNYISDFQIVLKYSLIRYARKSLSGEGEVELVATLALELIQFLGPRQTLIYSTLWE
jgi:hypothetical protein